MNLVKISVNLVKYIVTVVINPSIASVD